jgi:ABC transporter substrate binding protein
MTFAGTRVEHRDAMSMAGRRTFLATTLLVLLYAPDVAAQSAAVRRVGILASSSHETARTSIGIFRPELNWLGWREGQNLTIEARYAGRMRVALFVADVSNPSALDSAFAAIMEQRSEAFVVVADPMLFGQRRRIIDFSARHRGPAIYEYRVFAELGGLLSYGPHPHDRYRRAAVYVDRILRGAQPGELPVEDLRASHQPQDR